MGRKDSDELSAAQIMYPCMQCADIFFLKADICQLGMDQRKVRKEGRRQGRHMCCLICVISPWMLMVLHWRGVRSFIDRWVRSWWRLTNGWPSLLFVRPIQS